MPPKKEAAKRLRAEFGASPGSAPDTWELELAGKKLEVELRAEDSPME